MTCMHGLFIYCASMSRYEPIKTPALPQYPNQLELSYKQSETTTSSDQTHGDEARGHSKLRHPRRQLRKRQRTKAATIADKTLRDKAPGNNKQETNPQRPRRRQRPSPSWRRRPSPSRLLGLGLGLAGWGWPGRLGRCLHSARASANAPLRKYLYNEVMGIHRRPSPSARRQGPESNMY